MTEQGPHGISPADLTAEAQRLTGTVLVRIALDGGDEGDVGRDLAPLLGAKPGSDIWRIELSRLIAALVAGGLVVREGSRLRATGTGLSGAADFLGVKKGLPASWDVARDTFLVAKSLGVSPNSPSRLKMVRKPDGLRALIVDRHWRLGIKGMPTASRLRAALAVKALERAFGNQIRSGLGEKSGLPSKASRLLASQLSATGREFGSDSRLVAALAAEAVGTRRTDLKSLQLAALKQFLGRNKASAAEARAKRGKGARRLPTDDAHVKSALARERRGSQEASREPLDGPGDGSGTQEVGLPAAEPAPMHPSGSAGSARANATDSIAQGFMARPDPDAFARAVLAATDESAEGWSGNRKAFISKVWAVLQSRQAKWALTEIEFKCMLTEAHRTGLIVLANADLKDKRALKDLQESAVVYKNTVWHYVRAAD